MFHMFLAGFLYVVFITFTYDGYMSADVRTALWALLLLLLSSLHVMI